MWLCKIFKVSKSGYYRHIKREITKREVENEILLEKVKKIFYEHRRRYGCRRIKRVLSQEGIQISKKRISRLMSKANLIPKGTSYRYRKSKALKFAHDNLINQNFNITGKNKIWFGDITYIPTREGTIYLSVFIDGFTRKCVGYSIDTHMREQLVLDSFNDAIQKQNPPKGLIVHTDQGSQYTGTSFVDLLRIHHFIPSNSRKGNPYDNAMMESFYKTFKREVMPSRIFKPRVEAKLETLQYVSLYYNEKRHHSSLDYMTPSDFDILNS